MSLVAPNVEIKTTTTTANVTWSGVGAEAKMFTVRLTRTDVPDGAELVMRSQMFDFNKMVHVDIS